MSPATCAIRDALRESGLTQAQVAARAGVSERTVWAIIADKPVGMRALFAVCAALKIHSLPIPHQPASSCEVPRA